MSDVELLKKEELITNNSIPGFNSVGQILCYYRKLKGLTLEEIAQNTRIKIKYLYSLEQDVTDSMPSPVYVYSYIKHYAKQLGLDGTELVKLYQRQFDVSDNINVPTEINSSKIVSERSDLDIMYLQEKDVLELSNNNGNNGHDSLDFDKLYNDMSNVNNEQQHSIQTNSYQETNNMQAQDVFSNQLEQEKDPVVTQEIIDASAQAERIILNARREADRIVKEARQDAVQLKFEAQQYAETILRDLEQELTQALYQVKNGKEFIRSQKK